MDSQKIQELQVLNQKLQNTLLQKQAFQMESAETEAALAELEKSGEEVFKIIGQLMIKTDKSKIKEELANKQKLLDIRLQSLEKQEETFSNDLEKLREELTPSK